MPEGTAIIDCGLPALRTPMSQQFGPAVLAVAEQRYLSIFRSSKPTPSWRHLRCGDRRVTENNLGGIIGHLAARLQKFEPAVYFVRRHPLDLAVVGQVPPWRAVALANAAGCRACVWQALRLPYNSRGEFVIGAKTRARPNRRRRSRTSRSCW